MGASFGPLSSEIAKEIDVEVLSSDEEVRRTPHQNKNPHFRRKTKRPLQPVFAADGKSILLTPRQPTEQDAHPVFPGKVLPFAEMVAQAPHLCLDPARPDKKCKGESDEAKKKRDDAKMASYRENPLAVPEFDPIFKELLGALHPSDISVQIHGRKLTQEEIVDALNQGTVVLHTVSSDTESALLAEAGTFTIPQTGARRTYLPCINGECGCFMFARYQHIGRSWMTDDEYSAFCTDNKTPPQRICIVCHRRVVTGIYISMMAEAGTITVDAKTTLLQQFCNKKECKGGYKEEFMLFAPPGQKIRGMWGPFVMFQPKFLKESKEACSGAWCLDQSALIWKPQQTLSPEIGETNRDFQ